MGNFELTKRNYKYLKIIFMMLLDLEHLYSRIHIYYSLKKCSHQMLLLRWQQLYQKSYLKKQPRID